METIFMSHKVEHPMTVIATYFFKSMSFETWQKQRGKINNDYFLYNAWFFKTLELEEARYILPLN